MSGNLPCGVTDGMVDVAVGGDDDHFEGCPMFVDADCGFCECDEIGPGLVADWRAGEVALWR